MQRLQGDGWAFIHAGGTLMERQLGPRRESARRHRLHRRLPAVGGVRHPDGGQASSRRSSAARGSSSRRCRGPGRSGCSRCRSRGWRTGSSPRCRAWRGRARGGLGPRRPRQHSGGRPLARVAREALTAPAALHSRRLCGGTSRLRARSALPSGRIMTLPTDSGSVNGSPTDSYRCTMPANTGSDDEHGAHHARLAVAVAAMFCVAVAAPPPSPTRTPPSTATTAISTRRASGSTRSTRSTSGAPRATSRSCASAATGRRRTSTPSGSTPGPERLGTQRPERLPLGNERGRARPGGLHQLPLPPRRGRRPRAAARVPRVRQPRHVPDWQDLCRECHGAGLEKRSPHAGDDRSCAFCHSIKPQPGQPVAVTPAGRKLCEFCHGFKGEDALRRRQPLQGAAGLHGMPRPAPGQGSPRAPEGRAISTRSATRSPSIPTASAPSASPATPTATVRPPAGRRRGRPLPALSRLREDPGDEPPDDQGSRRLHDSPGVAARRRGHDVPDLPRPRPRPRQPCPAVADEPADAPYLLRGGDGGQAQRRLLPVPREGPVGRAQPPPGGRAEEDRVHAVSRRGPGLGAGSCRHREFRRGHQHPLPRLPRRRPTIPARFATP